MRISSGGAQNSHRAGMSALWHDAEYIPQKQLDTPTVQKGLEGMALPSEEHQLPEGRDDPFAKQERAYDVAAQQMERGIKGMEFLNGKPAALRAPQGASAAAFEDPAHDPVDHAHDVSRTIHQQQNSLFDKFASTNQAAAQSAQKSVDQLQKRVAAGKAPPPVSNAATEANATQKAKHNKAALDMGQGLGVAMAGIALASAVDPSAVGGAMAAEAAAVVKAAATSKLAVGMSKAITDTPDAVRTERARAQLSGGHAISEKPDDAS